VVASSIHWRNKTSQAAKERAEAREEAMRKGEVPAAAMKARKM